MTKQRKSTTLTVLLAVIDVPLAAASTIAYNAATADPPRWPDFLAKVPIEPKWALVPLIAATLAVTATAAIRAVRKGDDPPSVITGIGIATTGDNSPIDARGATIAENLQQNILSATSLASHEANAPEGTHNLPPASAIFVGREIENLSRAFTGSVGVIGQAVHGLGGVGKTELGLQYAHANADRYPLRWWITADSPDNITLGLTALTDRLNPVRFLADARAWALGYLQAHHAFLLVLDNVEDINHITDLLGTLTGHGHILITTRRDIGHADWTRQGINPIQLGVLDRGDSIELLRRLTGNEFQPDHANTLAERLGDLPLALEQAAAYITQNPGLGVTGYLRLLTDSAAALYAAEGAGSRPNRAVARVWRLTMTVITDTTPLAGQILNALAYLAPDNLPEHTLMPLASPTDMNNALAQLASYSMITRMNRAVSIHRLVQAVTRTEIQRPADPTELVDAQSTGNHDRNPSINEARARQSVT